MISRLRYLVYSYISTLDLDDKEQRLFHSWFDQVTDTKEEKEPDVIGPPITLLECQERLAHINERTARQKKDGVYYTPEDLTEYMVLNAFNCYCYPNVDNVNDKESLYSSLQALSHKSIRRLISASVFDPTCGAGEFLLTAFKVKYSLLKATKSMVSDNDIVHILSSIKGNDIAPDSIIITKSRLLIEAFSLLSNKSKVEDVYHAMEGNFTVEDYVLTIRPKAPLYDIMLGNPPYFEYSTLTVTPEGGFGNVYCDVLNNVCQESSNSGVMAFVVPLSYVSTPRMSRIRTTISREFGKQFVLSFADRPDCLFVSAHQKLCIVIGAKRSSKDTKGVYTSTYYYWYKSERDNLFHNLSTSLNVLRDSACYPKLGNRVEVSLFEKTHTQGTPLSVLMAGTGDTAQLYLNMRGCFWMKVFSFSPGSNEYKAFPVKSEDYGLVACILNSSLFFTQWIAVSDCWHITRKDFNSFRVPAVTPEQKALFNNLFRRLEQRLEETKEYIGSKQVEYEYKHRLCKDIIDEIDDALGVVYDLLPEELQYVKSFKLKYRLSNDEQ